MAAAEGPHADPAHPTDADVAAEVRLEQLRMVFAHMGPGTVIATVFALGLAAHVREVAGLTAVWAWVILKLAVALPRVIHSQVYRLRNRPGTPGWQHAADALLALDGVVWGIGGAWMMRGPVETVAVVAASLCAVASVATFGLQVRVLSTAAYVTPMIVPTVIGLYARGDQLGLFAGTGLLLFLGLLLATARISEKRLAEVFRLRLLTDRISAERAEALEQARRQSLVKTHFLAAMSHELRTPLHGMLGLTRVLRGQYGEPELRHRLGLIEHSGEHLLQLINDLLDSSRIEAGHVEISQADFDLVAELDELGDIYFVRAQEKGLRFICRNELGPEEWVHSDPTRLRQVLHNLLGNALKFTDRGHVLLQVRRLPSGPVQFVVEDSGPGIATEELGRVFEAFYQAAAGRNRAAGAGLGLSISLEMARAMGGTITCDSELGRGSVFVLELPLPVCAERPAAGARESAWMLGDLGDAPRRVLLAEDNEVNAMVVEAMLARIGCSVTKVDNGDDAVRLGAAADRDIDIVLMDCQMPVVDGLEATRRIRAREAKLGLAPVPVVALTANTAIEDREACRRAGMDHFLGKPFTERELLAAMAACMQGA